MNQSERAEGELELVLSACEDYMVHELFSAETVLTALLSALPDGERIRQPEVRKIAVSDFLADGFLYKPLICDMAAVDNDEDYKILKKLKACRYMASGLYGMLQGSDFSVERFRKSGRLSFEQNYLMDRYARKWGAGVSASDRQLPVETAIDTHCSRPIRLRIRKGGRFHVLMRAPAEMLDGSAGMDGADGLAVKLNRIKTDGAVIRMRICAHDEIDEKGGIDERNVSYRFQIVEVKRSERFSGEELSKTGLRSGQKDLDEICDGANLSNFCRLAFCRKTTHSDTEMFVAGRS